MQNIPLVIVTPVYEDREASTQLFQDLASEFGASAYLVVVDDGSVREPVAPSALKRAGLSGVVKGGAVLVEAYRDYVEQVIPVNAFDGRE